MFDFKYPAWFCTPTAQVTMVGITCFCTVGMFSAINNLGAGGTQDVALSDETNGILYGFFALTGLVSGGINNILGPRLTMFIGTLGYALYVGALWCHQTQNNSWFLVLSGAILGITAALLWSAQGAIMMAYPLEKDKGKAFGIFWAIFQLGSFVGAVIALAINIRSGGLSAVATSTYIAFLIIIFIGVASTVLLVPPNKIIRADGSIVKLEASSTPAEEIKNMISVLKDWRMAALLPMFFASNWFYAYQGAVNAFYFDGPTRALNATLEGAGAIIGALMIGFFVLDAPRFKRKTRGYLGLAIVTCITVIVWSCALAWQVTFNRGSKITKINYHEGRYTDKGTLYFFYYFGDAMYQALAYWIMGAISNDPFTLARYAGLYKAVQSAGGAGSYGMDAVATPFLNEHLSSWLMMLVSFPLAALVISTVKETSYTEEKTLFVEDVAAARAEAGAYGVAAVVEHQHVKTTGVHEAASDSDVKEKIDE
ncbi:MFS general substrate transporter [Clavulina sp. PMI_390]|nr:MFS general substrate transporter [Clavulina sp. PMI_390]